MNTALQSGLIGMQNAQQRVNSSANSIAKNGSVDGVFDPLQSTRDIVELRQASLAFHASVAIVKSSDKMLGAIIDVKV